MQCGFDLVIFDCDGVLVDSERIANAIFAKVLEEECGLQFSLEEMVDRFVGHSQAQCMQIVEELTGETPPSGLWRRYKQEINLELANSVVAVNEIEPVLQNIDLPYCVASSGSHDKMKITLARSGLAKYFNDNIFSSSEVAQGKPHPDIYLYAAESMGVLEPAHCLVIEDSPIGVRGAVAASMTVFGYSELMKADKLRAAGAHLTFDKMGNLFSEIQGYLKDRS